MRKEECLVVNKSAKDITKKYLELTQINKKTLIEISGFACAQHLLKSFGPFDGDHICVCTGSTDKGSIGLVIAFYLAKHAKKITIYSPLLTTDEVNIETKQRIVNCYPNIEISNELKNADIYIDCLLDEENIVNNSVKEVIEKLNRQTNPLIAINHPSETNDGTVINADVTLAIGVIEEIKNNKKKAYGHISLIEIGFPDYLMNLDKTKQIA